MALGRTVAGEIGRRSTPGPTPLRRGATAVVISGGALSLAGVAATIPLQIDRVQIDRLQVDRLQVDPSVVAAAAVLPVSATGPSTAAPTDDEQPATGLAPVAVDHGASGGEQLDTAKLVKAVQLAERATTRAAEPTAEPGAGAVPGADEDATATRDAGRDAAADEKAAPPARTPAGGSSGDCGLDSSQLGPVKPHVRAAANFLGCRFGEPTVLGVAGRGGSSDHPSGKALDFMVDRSTGNALAACALRDQEALGVSYVIWRQRINFGSGWKPMEDRGSPTANHMDHVHVSFESKAGSRPSAC